MGGSIITYSTIIGANIVGGFFESILGYFLKYLKKFFPPVVTGTIILSIGLNVIPVGFYSCCGGKKAFDFASIENILLSLSIIIIILFFQNRKNTFIRNFIIAFISILIGNLLCAYSDLLTFMPDSINFIFKNSSAMFVALIAIILNITIPNKTKITRGYP